MLTKNELLQERYRIIRQLGHGGMGAVYEAQDERLGSAVALKEIIIDLDKIPTEKQRELLRRAFEREAKLLANLHHEVFPRVMDYFSEQNRQYLIMELVHGEDLSELLSKNKKPFPLEKTSRWLDDLLDALDYLHTQTLAVFHRDIKPQNLKLTSRGKIKLLDFGIAKSVEQNGSTIANQTFVGATLDYAPIEQVLPATPTAFREFIVLKHKDKATAILEQSTDARCDIYAVGATFYHLLTNRVPIDSAKRSLQIWEGDKDPLLNPLALNPEIPPQISAWLLKALEVERENRFSSAIEMQNALQKAIKEAKAESKTTNKIIHLPVQPPSEEQQQRMRAETEKLVEIKQTPTEIHESEIIETHPLIIKPLATQTLPSELPVTENLSHDFSETSPAVSLSQFEIIGATNLYEKKTSMEFPPSVKEPIKEERSRKNILFWILPTALLGVLTVVGVGGMVWLGMSSTSSAVSNQSNSNQSISNQSTSNGIVSAPANTQINTSKNTLTVSPSATPIVSSTVQSKNTPPPDKTEPTKPTVIATPSRNPTPVITIKKTPKPVKTQNLSDDCIYNGKCK